MSEFKAGDTVGVYIPVGEPPYEHEARIVMSIDKEEGLVYLDDNSSVGKDKYSGEYMVLAIIACISGLTNSTYSTMPMLNLDGCYFKSLRIEKGFTLRQTEDATGISNSYLSQFENGKINKPSQNVVNKLLNWYNNGLAIEKSEFDPKGTLKT